MRHGYRKISDHVAREIRHSRLSTKEGKEIVEFYSAQPVYIKDFFNWLDVSSSGYEWFLSNKFEDIKHLISDTKASTSSEYGSLPPALQKVLLPGKMASKDFSIFLKGISL